MKMLQLVVALLFLAVGSHVMADSATKSTDTKKAVATSDADDQATDQDSGQVEEYLDGSWATEPYDADKYAVVHANDKKYKTAKENGDWVTAEKYAVDTYAKGWMHVHQAREKKNSSWDSDVAGLQAASKLYEEAKAIGQAAQKVDDPRGDSFTQKSKDDGEAIVAQCDENIDKIKSRIDELNNPKPKKSHKKKKVAKVEED